MSAKTVFDIYEQFERGCKPFFFIGGPCVIEDYEKTAKIAYTLKQITDELEIPFVFKASYDKANRTSVSSFRGPGIKHGLSVLSRIKNEFDVSIMSDIHRVSEVSAAAEVLDIIQIPAFLCRQTDLLLEAGKTGKPLNIKKGQFLAPWDMSNVIKKVSFTGNSKIMITERGVMFGYNNLVVDFRSIAIMKDTGHLVVFDATHSVQLPGSSANSSGGQRRFAPILAKAAVSTGVDGIFMEVYENPEEALCDGPNSIRLDSLFDLLKQLRDIKAVLA